MTDLIPNDATPAAARPPLSGPAANDTGVVSPVLEAAHTYAELSWRVVPIKPGQKRPALNAWQNVATTDPDTINLWWTTSWLLGGERVNGPDCGVGIATGAESDIFVLDVDVAGDKRGAESLAELEATYGPLPPTVEATTPSGGRHLYFQWPIDQEVSTNANRLGEHLDIRGHGGQVLAPPTVAPIATPPTDRPPYSWRDGHSPDDIPVADAPGWLLALLEPEAVEAPTTPTLAVEHDGGTTPAEHFNNTTTWDQLLTHDGWTLAHTTRTGEQRWTRPGKHPRDGISATVGHNGRDCLKVFTSSVPGLTEGQAYSRFGYQAAIHHNGDRSACSAAIRSTMPRDHDDLSWAPPMPNLPPAPAMATATTDETTGETTIQWAEPDPLEPTIGHGPPFPVRILPDWIAHQVLEVANSFQVPHDLPAMLALGALSIATMGRIKVKLTGSRWTEHTNTYLVCAMPPGAGKSPVFKVMTRPLVRLQDQLIEAAATDVREAEAKHELLERRAKAAFDQAAKVDATPEQTRKAMELRAELEELVVPARPRLLAEDTTPEALVALMGDHNGRMALLSSEGGIFDMMAGQYADKGKTANLAVYLQGWSGDSITQDRIGRAAIKIDEALLSICVTTQPAVLAKLGENPELAGRGLPVRFMFAVPPSNVGHRDRRAVLNDISDGTQQTYDTHLLDLGHHVARWANPAVLELTTEARDAFLAWDQHLEARQAPGEDLAPLAEWVSKLRATVLRAAGLLHLADGAHTQAPIEIDTMVRALELAAYWLAHAQVVHDGWAGFADPAVAKARAVIDWALAEDLQDFSASDLQKRRRSVFPKIEDVVGPLEMLVEAGWLHAESGIPIHVGARGKASPRFVVHPEAREHRANGAQLVADPPVSVENPGVVDSFAFRGRGLQEDPPTPQNSPSAHTPPQQQNANETQLDQAHPPTTPTTHSDNPTDRYAHLF